MTSMPHHALVAAAIATALLAGCGRDTDNAPTAAAPSETPRAAASNAEGLPAAPVAQASAAPDAVIDRQVWRVSASSAVAVGSLYVFLPDGTLLMASPGSTLGTGSWRREAGGGITMVEESRPYAVDVLEATPQRLRLRSHNPGTPVDITLEPAGRGGPAVPARFIGEWATQARDCGVAGSESRLRIDAERIRLHEASGPLAAVLPAGPEALALVAKVAGEGQERLLYRRYRLSADGGKLVDVTDGAKGGLARVRCG